MAPKTRFININKAASKTNIRRFIFTEWVNSIKHIYPDLRRNQRNKIYRMIARRKLCYNGLYKSNLFDN